MFVYSDEVPPKKWEDETSLHLIRPATGQAANVWSYSDITDKYREVEAKAEELWTKAEKQAHEFCVHGPACKRPNCEAGKAIQTIHIVTGQFVVLWGFLQECVPKGKKLRLVQVAVKRREAGSDAKNPSEEKDETTEADEKSETTEAEKSETMEVEKSETTEAEAEAHADKDSDSDSERTVDTEESIGITDSEDSQPESEPKEEELLITGVRILGSKSEALKTKLKEMQEIQEREGRHSLCVTSSGEATETDGGAAEEGEGGRGARAEAADAGACEAEDVSNGRFGLLATGSRRQLLRVRSRLPSHARSRALHSARSVNASLASSVFKGGSSGVGSCWEVDDFFCNSIGGYAWFVSHCGEHAWTVSACGVGGRE